MACEIYFPHSWTRIQTCGPGGLSIGHLVVFVKVVKGHLHGGCVASSMLGLFFFQSDPPVATSDARLTVLFELFYSLGT